MYPFKIDHSALFHPRNDVTPLALVVLNTDSSVAALQQLMQRASFCVFADGGSNRVHDACMHHDPSGKLAKSLLPSAIAGDWDSIRPEVAEFYADLGVRLEKDDGQDDNDLWKSLKVVQQWMHDCEENCPRSMNEV